MVPTMQKVMFVVCTYLFVKKIYNIKILIFFCVVPRGHVIVHSCYSWPSSSLLLLLLLLLLFEDSTLIDKIVSNIPKDASFSFTKNSLWEKRKTFWKF